MFYIRTFKGLPLAIANFIPKYDFYHLAYYVHQKLTLTGNVEKAGGRGQRAEGKPHK